MYSENVTVVNATGIHARPASQFSKMAAGFQSNVTVKKSDAEGDGVNAKSVLNLMTQGLTCGTEITIAADGEDENEAVAALVEFVKGGCGE